MRRIFLLLSLAASPVSAQSHVATDQPENGANLPAIIRWMISPTRNGMFLTLPSVDTDPNSGTSVGVMPVWVVMSGSTVRHIHVGGLDYNNQFGVGAKYQYFYFPSPDTNFQARAGLSKYWNREFVLDYNTTAFLGRSIDFGGRFEHSKDGSKRFYGFGPNSPENGESNYTLDTINYRFSATTPFYEGSHFHAGLIHAFQANDVSGAPPPIPDTVQIYPDVAKNIVERHHNFSGRAILNYDTRDSDITTTRGTLAQTFIAGATKDVISEYNYYRYGLELRNFIPVMDAGDPEPRFITATRLQFEQLVGRVPLWLMETVGGKYSLRSYGEGRFTDNGMFILGGEERCRIAKLDLMGVTTSFWLDPFFGFGTVFLGADEMMMKYMHPSVGAALRVIGRPQIVGSADFGYGQEGLKVFLDVNYSY